MSTRTRFEKEAKGNSEMVYYSHHETREITLILLTLKAGSHVRRKRKRKRKRKHKEVHTSNANASTVQYASAIEYSKMVDEVEVLVLLFFRFLGLRRIRRRRPIQRNNKSRPKGLWVREIFQKRQLFPFLSQHLPF